MPHPEYHIVGSGLSSEGADDIAWTILHAMPPRRPGKCLTKRLYEVYPSMMLDER